MKESKRRAKQHAAAENEQHDIQHRLKLRNLVGGDYESVQRIMDIVYAHSGGAQPGAAAHRPVPSVLAGS